MAKWIWYPGEFEIYHSLQLHTRRYERGVHIPCQWGLPTVYPNVSFRKHAVLTEETTLTAYATAPGVVEAASGQFPRMQSYSAATGQPLTLPAGEYDLSIQLMKPDGLPAVFVDAGPLSTDESWTANHGLRTMGGGLTLPQAACTPAFTRPTDNPEVFPFAYERWDPVSVRTVDGGTLYDFGRESFGAVHLEGCDPAQALVIRYGESEAEALDDRALFREARSGAADCVFPNFALRYVWVSGGAKTVWLNYEYLPLTDRADFVCDQPQVKQVFDVCSHTFHLNSREFFLDGIKRDRWVWSGDAYQSYMVNNYLFFDPELTKRTIRALLGKPPYEQHINNINDYSLYLIISVWDYYYATGDRAFVSEVYDRLVQLYQFQHGRLDEQGLVCARPGDWIFIDWAQFDREGPQCAEQILLWKAMDTLDRLSVLLERPSPVAPGEAEALRQRVNALFWDAAQGAYIDTFASGRRHVTRHANVFAVLYDFAPEKVEAILAKVLHNEAIDPITTPYFKLFELMALCRTGDVAAAQEMILSYWYPMLELGATSIWEQFDPREQGAAHYAMYGDPYGRSLCHAWGSGPIYLLGRYVAGVAPTSVGYETFEAAPQPGSYQSFAATVPLPAGSVTVRYDAAARTVSAAATHPGGTLRFAGQCAAIPTDGEAVIRW